LNRESQKLVPTRNFSHLEPQKFVPANHKKSPIRKIKLPQNFHATRYLLLEKGTEINNTTYLVIHKQEKGRSKCYHEQQKEKQDLKEKDIMIEQSVKIDHE